MPAGRATVSADLSGGQSRVGRTSAVHGAAAPGRRGARLGAEGAMASALGQASAWLRGGSWRRVTASSEARNTSSVAGMAGGSTLTISAASWPSAGSRNSEGSANSLAWAAVSGLGRKLSSAAKRGAAVVPAGTAASANNRSARETAARAVRVAGCDAVAGAALMSGGKPLAQAGTDRLGSRALRAWCSLGCSGRLPFLMKA